MRICAFPRPAHSTNLDIAAAGRSHLLDESLLPALRVRQVVREYLYAARHLPHWRYVPHSALPALIAQTPGRPV